MDAQAIGDYLGLYMILGTREICFGSQLLICDHLWHKFVEFGMSQVWLLMNPKDK